MSLRVSLHFKTGEVCLRGILEVVMFVHNRCGVISPRGRSEKEARP